MFRRLVTLSRHRAISANGPGAAGSLVALVGYYYPVEGWVELGVGVQALRIALKLIGGALLGGLAGKLIGDALAQTGALNNFPIGKTRTREI